MYIFQRMQTMDILSGEWNVNMDFMYQKHIDLVFHVLAHIKVDNPSDLFFEPYVEKMSLAIPDPTMPLPPSAVRYYNPNFDRLGIINFLPFFTQTTEELIRSLEDSDRFSEKDHVCFLSPLIEALTRDSAQYFEFWERQFEKENANRLRIEAALRSKIGPYSFLFDHYRKSAKAWLSFSMTKNGRGITGISGCFSAAVPYPFHIDQLDTTFFMLLHEYTHQFTDAMIGGEINMDDGSHALSETVAILVDYYLIKHVCKNDVTPYLSWLAPNDDETYIDEDLFLHIFQVPAHIRQRIDQMVEQLLTH